MIYDYSPLIQATKGELRLSLENALKNRKLIRLRDYQVEARDCVVGEWEAGRRTMLAMSVGTGKTECLLSCADWVLGQGLGRVLLIAHREELIFQPVERILRGWDLPCPGIVMGSYRMMDKQIIVATVQTLAIEKRLNEIFAHGKIGAVIVDEFHHASSRTYREIVEKIYQHNPKCLLLGVTATPRRSDEKGLAALTDSVAYRLSISEAIKREILCPFTAKVAQMGFDLKGVKRSKDGWNEKSIEELMTASNALDVIVEKWIEEASGKPTAAFVATVKQAEELAIRFQEKGVSAGFLCADTDKEVRRDILSKYDSGEIKVICNQGIITEGWDSPHTACIIMARPTSSGILFTQILGRGLRKHATKPDGCLILQFVPIDAPIDMFLVGDLLGKPKKQQKAEKKAKEAGVILDVFGVDVSGEGWEAEPDKIIMQATDIFARGANRNLAWTLDPQTGIATLGIGIGGAIGIIPPNPIYLDALNEPCAFPQWHKWIARQAGWKLCRMSNNRDIQVLGHYDSMEEAQSATKEYLRKDDTWGRSRKAEWRSKPATPKRQSFARQLGVWRSGMLDGEASQAITARLFINLARKKVV